MISCVVGLGKVQSVILSFCIVAITQNLLQ